MKPDFKFLPLTIDEVEEIAGWRYNGFEKRLYMAPYIGSNNLTGKLVGPGGCIGFSSYLEDRLAGIFEFTESGTTLTIGLALNPQFVGKGFGVEFTKQGIRFGIDKYPNVGRIELTVHPENVPAVKTYLKVGFAIDQRTSDELKMSLHF